MDNPNLTRGDLALLAAFEACTLPKQELGHREHVRLAWVYLQQSGALVGIRRFVAALRRFARANAVPGLYHETITWAYLLLVNERIAKMARSHGWEEFAAENPDLLRRGKAALRRYYSDEALASDLARQVFVFPDGRGSAAEPAATGFDGASR